MAIFHAPLGTFNFKASSCLTWAYGSASMAALNPRHDGPLRVAALWSVFSYSFRSSVTAGPGVCLTRMRTVFCGKDTQIMHVAEILESHMAYAEAGDGD